MKFKRLSLKNKNNMRLIIYILLLTFLSISSLHAATYNYYFSDDAAGNPAGNDTLGDGSQGNPWKTLSKAQSAINALGSGDTANLYFDRGDTWAISTGQGRNFTVDNSDPIVNIDAYGSGDRPIFDGGITDFSAVAVSGTGGYYFYNEVFVFQRNNCSMANVEIKRIYGNAIRIGSASNTSHKGDYFTLSDSLIHSFGYCGIAAGGKTGASNCTIERNTIHTGQELYKNSKVGFWGGGINLYGESFYPSLNYLIRHNVVYDIYGEGIQMGGGGVIEYNIVGDTGSVGIYPIPTLHDAYDTVVRYNFVIMSNSNDYRGMSGSAHQGINYFDENSTAGDNSNATVQIYGNIVINRRTGIKLYNGEGLGEIRVFNNTIIDSEIGNIVVNQPSEFEAGYIYNNTSILYDRTGATHVADDAGQLPHANWTIENNHFWTTGGYDCTTDLEDAGFDDYCKDGDPKLYGEEKGSPVNWDGQSGATYFSDITFADVTPYSGSGLIDTGKTIPYEDTFLSNESDFAVLPTTVNFVTEQQSHDSKWDVGAIIFSNSEAGLKPPVGLQIRIK